MWKKSAWALSLVLLQAATLASAQEGGESSAANPKDAIAGRFYVSPMATYTLTDKDRHADDGYGGVLAFGKVLNDGVQVETTIQYTRASIKGGGSGELLGFGAGLIIYPAKSLPGLFAVTQISYGRTETDGGNYNSTLVDLGAGYLIGPFGGPNGGSLRIEARARYDQPTASQADNYFDPVIGLGFLFPIGSPNT